MPKKGKRKREGIQRVDVIGRIPRLWAEFQPKLVEAINRVLDMTIDHEKGTTVREEAKEFSSAALDYLKARLRKVPLENEKSEAEIMKLYAEMEQVREKARKTRAETRILEAEAHAKERDNIIEDLRFALKLTKVMIAGEPGDEAILFGKKIERFLGALEEVGGAEREAGG